VTAAKVQILRDYFLKLEVAIESKIYQPIIGAKALRCKTIKRMIQPIRNMYCN